MVDDGVGKFESMPNILLGGVRKEDGGCAAPAGGLLHALESDADGCKTGDNKKILFFSCKTGGEQLLSPR